MIDLPNTTSLSQYNENLSGIYRGIVEDNRDPMKLARVRVRIPMIHGVSTGKNYLNSTQLPWATPITPSGSGYDHGSCLIPDVGDLVFVMFEDNDRNYPLYLGGCYGKSGDYKYYGDETDPTLYNGTQWTFPKGLSEVPNEVYNASGSPTGKIVYKSPKGATIIIEEEDGKESVRILDALGQSIRLGSSITKISNNKNGAKRIDADAYKGTAHHPSRFCNDSYAEIAITGANGQQIQMLTNDIGSSISIKSGEGGSGAKLLLDDDEATIEVLSSRFRITEEKSEILVNGNHIILNADGSIELNGSGQITISADGSISILGNSKVKLKANTVDINSTTCIIRGDLINYSN